jgi:hypothetical protein
MIEVNIIRLKDGPNIAIGAGFFVSANSIMIFLLTHGLKLEIINREQQNG